MTPLENQQKQLLFDYCMGLASQEQAAEAERLISSNNQAAQIYSQLKAALWPLESIEAEDCPDDLAERTILRLNNYARSTQLQLEQLLAAEQARDISAAGRFWPNFGKRLAMAAVFMIVGTVVITAWNITSGYMRQKSWQQHCQMQLARMFQGITGYSSDHDGQLPAVATSAGSPWWKVGYQGNENHSNTRHMWLLAKGDYVNPAVFVCPGVTRGQAVTFDSSQLQNYNDFPDRKFVSYSFRVRCNKPAKDSMPAQTVLIADLNPLFENLPENYSAPFKLQLNERLLTRNSINHNRRGQNVLFCDGSVKFVDKRRVGIDNDDIFTLWNTKVYQGCEVPSCETDAFLAP